jgi:hypothetical protein
MDQRWFWTERWQAMEREVDEHVAAGLVTVVDGPDALFEHLDTSLTSCAGALKFGVTPAFEGDWARLSKAERATFQEVVSGRFHPARERRRTDPPAPWPASLRVKDVEGGPGVWEMTWSFAGPDGRATFEWIEIEGETAIRWRRIGGHAIFGAP